ncbi:MAG: protein-L-isoaspartate(D-aspartate) O-methyltransferase [Deltaproteobacteria bacterium]
MSNTDRPATQERKTPDAFAELRRRMVDEQLREHGISDPRLLDAMGKVPREEFVPEDLRYAAYEDGPLPIGFGQTISQPFTVAWMCQALQLVGTEKVLEIGAGSGYSAAILSLLAKSVFTVERIPGLADTARARLARLGYANVQVITADGTLGLPAEAPFDAIVVTAGAEALPDAYVRQLHTGGRIIIPIGGYRYDQTMYRFTRLPEELRVENLGGFAFVPLIGKYGWHEPDVE